MGMNKLYVTKSTILSYLERNKKIDEIERDIKIEKVFSAECRVTDTWSANFLADLNKEERAIRKDYFKKCGVFADGNLAEQMKSRAETLISLYTNANQVFDVWAAVKILNVKLKTIVEEAGNDGNKVAEIIRDKLIATFE